MRGHEFSEISPPFQKKPALDPATDPIPNQPTTVPTPFPYSLPTLKPTIALDFNLDPAIVAGTVVLIVSAWIVLYLRSEEELASLNYIGKAYIVVPEYFIKGALLDLTMAFSIVDICIIFLLDRFKRSYFL